MHECAVCMYVCMYLFLAVGIFTHCPLMQSCTVLKSIKNEKKNVNLPQICVCGRSFCVEHAFNCPCGGFPSIRHNEVRDLTASLLSEVCSDVGVEPALQSLDGEALQFSTANREEGARLRCCC